jgi:hypothetical protein
MLRNLIIHKENTKEWASVTEQVKVCRGPQNKGVSKL